MARIKNIDLPKNKRIVIALTYIYGIGPTRAHKICEAAGVSEDTRTDNLTVEEINKLRAEADKYELVGDLKREVEMKGDFKHSHHSLLMYKSVQKEYMDDIINFLRGDYDRKETKLH